MANYQTQILDYMRKHGSITNREAFQHIGITRLGSAIFNLRKHGYNITTLMIEGSTSEGIRYYYGRYILKESEEN